MKNRYLALGLAMSLVIGATATTTPITRVQAIELANGTTAFVRPPQFIDAFTTQDRVMRRNATYFFTLDLPPDADAPL